MYCPDSVDLRSWTVLKISGNDLIPYLNGIITLELTKLDEQKVKRAAFLSPQGKIRSIFWITKEGSSIIIFNPPEFHQVLIEDLLKYKLSLNVKLEDISEELEGFILHKSEEKIDGLFLENCNYGFEKRKYTKDESTITYEEFSNLLVLNSTCPPHLLIGEIPWEAGLADMIDLDKGCFLGQEPISRMVYRGRLRKQLYFGLVEGEISNEVYENEKKIGNVLGSVSHGNERGLICFLPPNTKDKSDISIGQSKLLELKLIGSYPKFIR